jgi:hypothetical protein
MSASRPIDASAEILREDASMLRVAITSLSQLVDTEIAKLPVKLS